MSASYGPHQHALPHAGVPSRTQYPAQVDATNLQHDPQQQRLQHHHHQQHQQQQQQQQQQQHYGYNQPAFHTADGFMPPAGLARYPNSIGSAAFAVPTAEAATHGPVAHLQQHPPSLAQSGSASSSGSVPDHRGSSSDKYSQGYANWKSASPMTPVAATTTAAMTTAVVAPPPVSGHNTPESSTWAAEPSSSRSGKRNRQGSEAAAKVETPDDEVKRARGRPRLETTDKNASERRRTQIRLAQRAYRRRKENAMDDLESQVKKLKTANVELLNAFQRLSACAQQYSGVISQAPELSRHMQKIRELAEKRKESARSESPTGSDNGLEHAQHDPTETTIKMEDSKNSNSPIQKIESQTQHLLGGIVVNYEPEEAQNHQMQSHDYNGFSGQGASEYEVIAVPTAENASFAPNKINLEAVFMQAMPWSTQQQLQTMQATHVGSIQASAFSRTLYRQARERTATLINADNPPIERVLRVFGFSTVFESLDDIRRRGIDDLQASRNEANIYNMHFPLYQAPNMPGQYASDGSGRIVMSGVKMSDVRGKLFEMSKILQVPASRSVLWDCDEVDWFFSQRGVMIGDAVGIFSAEINVSAFWPQDFYTPQAARATQFDNAGMESRGHDDMSFDQGQERWNTHSTFGPGGPLPPNPELLSNGERKIVRIDIGKLLDGLSLRTVALGQTLGFRPSDVKVAFWEAMVE